MTDSDKDKPAPTDAARHPVPLAIVGIGCVFPRAGNPQQFWHNIREGVDAISDIPKSHWNPDEYFNADKAAPDMTYARRGGFIDPVDFDPLLYGLSPNNIEATDTTQLLGMVVARQALLDAGYSTSSDNTDGRAFDRSRTSVILGVTGTLELVIPLGARLGHPHWRRALSEAGVADDVADEVVQRIADSYVPWQENSFPGLLGNVAAGRIANRFDLGGTNCVVDAACASSLSAIHMAALELYSGRSDMAISGGFDTFNDIFMYMCFSKTPALSPTGNSRPFDINGDGTILGEGLGAIVLKRLDDARRDGDKVYAVLKGMGSSSDGRGNAIYAPSAYGQTRALKNAYHDAGVTPASIELVEAHGTGTRVGDAVEAEALSSVYREDRADGTWCAIGSVKSMIGHTKAAAGVAGLIKIAMALKHKVLPPTIKIDRPLEILEPGKAPVYVNTRKRPWLNSPGQPRRAALSAFGFGGSNFHCVLEEAEASKPGIEWDGDVLILALSGQKREDLIRSLAAININQDWDGLRYQATGSLQGFDARQDQRLLLVITPETPLQQRFQEIRQRLQDNKEDAWNLPDAIYGSGSGQGKLAMLFPGQGSQYPDMLLDLACQFPQMQAALIDADQCFDTDEGAGRLSRLIYPIPVFNEEARAGNVERLRSTRNAQPAIGAVSIGALRVLEHFGVHADITAGHSFGELTALCAAGRINDEDLFRLANKRGELMQAGKGDNGSMLAVSATAAVLHEILEAEQLDLIIANHNAPRQVVLSGASEQIDKAIKVLGKRGLSAKKLPVSAAFHSSFVADAEKPFAQFLENVKFSKGKLPVFANATAEPYPDNNDKAKALLASQLARPVEFVTGIENIQAEACTTFIEVGPGNVLTGLVSAILKDRPYTAIALDASRGRKPGQHDLACLLARLAAGGYPVQLDLWDEGYVRAYEERSTDTPAMSISLSGANYVKPRPGQEPVKKPINTPGETTMPVSPAPPATGNSDGRATGGNTDLPGTANDSLLRVTQEAITSLQKMQQQTADLHRQYLEGQEQAQQAIQGLLAQLQGGGLPETRPVTRPTPTTAATPTGEISPVPDPAPPAPVTPPPAPTEPVTSGAGPLLESLLLEVVSEKTGYPIDMLSLEMSLDTDLGIDSIKRVEILSALHEKLPGAGHIQPEDLGTFRLLKHIAEFLTDKTDAAAITNTSSPAEPAPAVADNTMLTGTLFEVVSDKTGYPPDMLNVEMNLDTDLGIDSIKRVEILSAFQEKMPELPAINPDELSRLQTLQQIIDYMGQAVPDVTMAATGTATADTPQARDSQLATTLLEVVSEKTGYPADMIKLEMNLDTDLGIDSIKRVEILSAFQERVPDAPAVNPDVLADLQTLQQIVDHMQATQNIIPASVTVEQGPSVTVKDPDLMTTSLLEVVAEKTGYPADMIKLEMNLDTDLGIDSIKRVEILSAYQEKMPDAPAINPDDLARLQTLQQIVEYMGEAKPVAAAPRPAAVVTEPAAAASLWRGVTQAVPYPESVEPLPLPRGATVCVTDDGSPLAGALCDELQRRAYQVERIAITDRPTIEAAGLVIVTSADTTDMDVLNALQLMQHLAPSLQKQGQTALLACITRLGGHYGLDQRVDSNPYAAAVAGLVKTADKEWPAVNCHCVDVDNNCNSHIVIDTLLSRKALESGVRGDQACYLQLQAADITREPVADERRLQAGELVVISGGARGITAEIAIELAEHYHVNLLLLGRSPMPGPEPHWLQGLHDEAAIKQAIINNSENRPAPREIELRYRKVLAGREINNTLERIKASGANVLYHAVDIRDSDGVQRALDEARPSLGPVTGIVHGAGVLADRLIVDKTPEQFREVFETKVYGLEALLQATRKDDLKALVLYSSSTARFGRKGQCDYAAANEVLNKIAQQEAGRRKGCRVLSMNWGPWDGGMVTPQLRRLFESEGVGVIPLRDGTRQLVAELGAQGPVEVLILGTAPGELNGKPVATSDPATAPDTGLHTAFERGISIDRYPLLRSHVMNGKAVLPAALILEWFAHGAMHDNPGMIFKGIDDMQIFKGVILDADDEITVQIMAGVLQDNGIDMVIPLELRQGMTRHAAANVVLGHEFEEAGQPQVPKLDGSWPRDKNHVYGDGRLFHGADLQGLKQIEQYSELGISGVSAAAPHPSTWMQHPIRTGWITDPLVIDAAFQLMILWSLEVQGSGSLPTRINGYRQFRRQFPRDETLIQTRIESTGNHEVRALIEFHDSKGDVIARMTDYHCVVDASLNGAFQRNRLEDETRA